MSSSTSVELFATRDERLRYRAITEVLQLFSRAIIVPRQVHQSVSYRAELEGARDYRPNDSKLYEILDHLAHISVRNHEVVAAFPVGNNIILAQEDTMEEDLSQVVVSRNPRWSEHPHASGPDIYHYQAQVSAQECIPFNDQERIFPVQFLSDTANWDKFPKSRQKEDAHSNWNISLTSHLRLVLHYLRGFHSRYPEDFRTWSGKRILEYVFIIAAPKVYRRINNGRRLRIIWGKSILDYLTQPLSFNREVLRRQSISVTAQRIEMLSRFGVVSPAAGDISSESCIILLGQALAVSLQTVAECAKTANEQHEKLQKAAYRAFNTGSGIIEDVDMLSSVSKAAKDLVQALRNLQQLLITFKTPRSDDVLVYLRCIQESKTSVPKTSKLRNLRKEMHQKTTRKTRMSGAVSVKMIPTAVAPGPRQQSST